MKAIRDRGRMAMRPYKFTMFYPFQPEKSSLKSLIFVGAHGNAPDDQSTQDRARGICVCPARKSQGKCRLLRLFEKLCFKAGTVTGSVLQWSGNSLAAQGMFYAEATNIA